MNKILISLIISICISDFLLGINRANKWYFYWGNNRAYYANSDISFTKDGTDFTLSDVRADDRPNPFSDIFSHYLNPLKMTIPQFNFRIGYYVNNNIAISLGFDHLKYVVDKNQIAKMKGTIDGKNYNEKVINSFLEEYEHTNGYNIMSVDIDYIDSIYFNDKFDMSLFVGGGLDIVYPKSAVTLKNREQLDKLHLAGVDISSKIGTELTFNNSYILRLIVRAGHSNMFDVLTTKNGGKAKQSIDYLQFAWVAGYRF